MLAGAFIVLCGNIVICADAGNANLTVRTSELTEFQTVINPEIPREFMFAGEKMSFDDVDMYERLDRELTSMIYTHGNTLLTIKRANRYFPLMAPILDKYGVHRDFLYLACIESFLNPGVKSPAGAVGIWQFMPATAKQYGLEVNDEVDERYDPEKETAAACRYINKAFAMYGNWASVASSYNAGTAKITKELESQMQSNALDLWLVEETRRYPFRMIAMKMILENPAKYGFSLSENQLYQPYTYTTVSINGPVADWVVWAKEHGISYATLRTHNPWIRAKKLTNKAGKTYTVKIPTADSQRRSKQKLQTYNRAWVNQNK